MKYRSNLLYLLCIGVLCSFIYCLNICINVSHCAIFFSLIALTINIISTVYGKTKTLMSLAISVIINFYISQNTSYYFSGIIFTKLIFVSLISVIISMYCITLVFQHFNKVFDFSLSNFLSLLVASVIDICIMNVFFIMHGLKINKIAYIVTQEMYYHTLYALIIYSGISATLYIYKNMATIR